MQKETRQKKAQRENHAIYCTYDIWRRPLRLKIFMCSVLLFGFDGLRWTRFPLRIHAITLTHRRLWKSFVGPVFSLHRRRRTVHVNADRWTHRQYWTQLTQTKTMGPVADLAIVLVLFPAMIYCQNSVYETCGTQTADCIVATMDRYNLDYLTGTFVGIPPEALGERELF